MNSPYLLAAQVQHSGNDLKCVINCKPCDASAGCPKLVTASRDYTLKSWMVGTEAMQRVSSMDSQQEAAAEDGEVDSVLEMNTMTGHTDYMQCCAEDPTGTVIVSGANDKTIRVWSSSTGSLIAVLVGHEAAAKSVAFFTADDGRTMLVSGGWDHKCCVWDLFGSRRLVMDCFQHTQPVLCVAAFKRGAGAQQQQQQQQHQQGGDLVLSSSGDKRVVLWDPSSYGKALMEFIGHTDTVQCVVQIDGGRFASAGNDGDILIWDVPSDAKNYMTMKTVRIPTFRINAHESFIYTLAWDADEKVLLSGGEDKTIRVWDGVADCGRNGNEAPPRNRQMTLQPCLVWSLCIVKGAKGPHVAAAGADGFLRLWTTNKAMVASPETMDAFNAAVSASGGASSGAGGASNPDIPDPATLPTAEQLKAQGPPERDGQRSFVQGAGGEVELYQGQGGSWVHVGTVISNPNATGGDAAAAASTTTGGRGGPQREQRGPPRKSQFFKGAAYDYLFPISVGENQLSLPYNAGESVYDAAQNFITDHGHLGVSQSDKEEIIQHIVSQMHSDDRDLLMNPNAVGVHRGGSADGAAAAAAASVSQTGRGVGSGPLLRCVFDVSDARPFNAIKAKLREFDALPDLERINGAVDALAAGPAPDAATHLLSSEVGLFGKLKDEQFLPFFDIVRIVAFRCPELIRSDVVDLVVAGAVGPATLKTSDDFAAAAPGGDAAPPPPQSPAQAAAKPSPRTLERVMAMRALCNIVMLCSGPVVVDMLTRHPKLIIEIRRHFLAPDVVPPCLNAAMGFFTNCAVRWASAAGDLSEPELERVPELMDAVGAWMTWEREEGRIAELLRISANLMLLATGETVRAVAASGSSDSIGPEVERLSKVWPANETLKALQAALQ